jgi:xanthine dehydrogenase accessory factor
VALVAGYDDEEWRSLPLGPGAYVVVVTHDHGTDQRLVERALQHDLRYLAMVGSQRKATLTRQRLEARDVAPATIRRLHSPAGLDIGAETPAEIALSIVAEMIAVRRREAISNASHQVVQSGSST